MKNFVPLIAFLIFLSACTTIVQNNGAEIHQVKLDQVNTTSTKADVFNLLGSPSTKSVYGQETWYYITNQIKRQLVRDDKVVGESVVAISFNGEHVDNVEMYDTKDHREFKLSNRVTPTAGKKLSAVEQILSNVGKFNGDKDKSGATIGSHAPGGGVPGGQ